MPVKKIVRVSLDNDAAHKHPKVRQWFLRHKRFTSFHADLVFVAQRRRGVFRQTCQAATKAPCLPMRGRSPSHHQPFRFGDKP